jgi:hypothetical protein
MRNPLWCTFLIHEKKNLMVPFYTFEEEVYNSSHPFCDHCRCVGSFSSSYFYFLGLVFLMFLIWVWLVLNEFFVCFLNWAWLKFASLSGSKIRTKIHYKKQKFAFLFFCLYKKQKLLFGWLSAQLKGMKVEPTQAFS